MGTIERFLTGLDGGVSSAIVRIPAAFLLLPLVRLLPGWGESPWLSLLIFVGLLAGLRVLCALLRRLLPFSADAQQVWAERRDIARWHDSYAWQKLFWLGLGILPHAVLGAGLQPGEYVVVLVCLVGGGAGLLAWLRMSGKPVSA